MFIHQCIQSQCTKYFAGLLCFPRPCVRLIAMTSWWEIYEIGGVWGEVRGKSQVPPHFVCALLCLQFQIKLNNALNFFQQTNSSKMKIHLFFPRCLRGFVFIPFNPLTLIPLSYPFTGRRIQELKESKKNFDLMVLLRY